MTAIATAVKVLTFGLPLNRTIGLIEIALILFTFDRISKHAAALFEEEKIMGKLASRVAFWGGSLLVLCDLFVRGLGDDNTPQIFIK